MYKVPSTLRHRRRSTVLHQDHIVKQFGQIFKAIHTKDLRAIKSEGHNSVAIPVPMAALFTEPNTIDRINIPSRQNHEQLHIQSPINSASPSPSYYPPSKSNHQALSSDPQSYQYQEIRAPSIPESTSAS
jgi:hypothetical protein